MPTTAVTVLPAEPVGRISPCLHGHFAEHLGRCCNDGLWVGPRSSIPNDDGLRTDVVQALARLGVPILRWPGGCYADTYHWRDGIGPRDSRPRTLGESCGLRVVEDNGLGTHEFIRLCRAIGAEPYLAGNVGSGTPQELMDWIHYCNGDQDTTLVRERIANGHPEPMQVQFWGVGNENWGCGGNMDPVDYAKEFRRFSTFARMADPSAQLVACGNCDREWNLKVTETLRNNLDYLDHLSVHRYYSAGPAMGTAEEDYYQAMRVGDLVEHDIEYTAEILRFFAAGRREIGIAFDEWGVWHPEARAGTYYEMPNTLRDAVAAAGVLDAFHRWCASVSMGNLAQVVNVLQTLIQTADDAMWLTPTYHLFDLYRAHRGARSLRTVVECDRHDAPGLGALKAGRVALLSASASAAGGAYAVSLSNRRLDAPAEVVVRIAGVVPGTVEMTVLAADQPNAINSVEHPDRVCPAAGDAAAAEAEVVVQLPACSVATLTVKPA